MTDRELMQMALDALGGAAEFMTRKMQEDAWKIQDLLSERLSQPEPDAVLAEREACAKLCDEMHEEYEGEGVCGSWLATAIRARGEK